MNFLSALAVLSASFYVVIGVFTFMRDPRQRLNLIFLALSLVVALWSFGLCLF